MLDLAFKDIKGHKVRSFLTVLGIVIAITAIVALGSISSGMNSYIKQQMSMVSGGVITLAEHGTSEGMNSMSTGQLDVNEIKEISRMDGVKEVGTMYIRLESGKFFVGVDIEKMQTILMGKIKLKEGEWPEDGEYGVVIGDYVHNEQGYDIGDPIMINGKEFTVCGVLEKMNTFQDFSFITTLKDMQDVYDDPDHVSRAFVEVENIQDANRIADEIEKNYPDIDAITQKDAIKRAERMVNQTRILTLGIGLIAAIVAAIGIINTMFMSVSERKRQIGIMKAIGAEEKMILIQVLEEAVILSIPGAIVGILLGFAGTNMLNRTIGMPIAKVTIGLAFFALLFSIGISILAAYYPAREASKISSIEAIREQ